MSTMRNEATTDERVACPTPSSPLVAEGRSAAHTRYNQAEHERLEQPHVYRLEVNPLVKVLDVHVEGNIEYRVRDHGPAEEASTMM